MRSYMAAPRADLRLRTQGNRNAARPMHCDIREFDDRYELSLEVPGFQKDDLKVSLKKEYLTVEAEHPKAEPENGRMLRSERYTGSYARTFHVGDDIDSSAVNARYENGILQIVLRKLQEAPAPSGRIEIQ